MQPQDDTSPIACLLIHGLNGSPYDFEDVAKHLSREGIPSELVLLPGHDTHVRDAMRYGWKDWARAVEDQFEQLASRYERVAIIGHSMGGTLALHLAANDPRVAAVATLCAPAEMHRGLYTVAKFGSYVVPFFPVFREDIRDRVERVAYARRKVSAWAAVGPAVTMFQALPIVRRELPRIHCPVLVMAARHDHVVPFRDGRYIYANIGSSIKEFVILDRSWHVVTRDMERDTVTAHVTSFLLRLLA